MSTAAEKAAARRAKILARAAKGNKVSTVTAESMAAEESTKIETFTSDSAKSTDNSGDIVGEVDSSPVKSSSGEASATPQSSEATSETASFIESDQIKTEVKEKALDDILEAAVEEGKPKEETPLKAEEEKPKVVSRPLAERRRKLAEKRKSIAEAAIAAGEEPSTPTSASEEADGDKPVEFISKSAREVELEIAAITRQKTDVAEADNDDTLKELKEDKVLMGRDRGSTGNSSMKRRIGKRTGAGASSPSVSSTDSDNKDKVTSSPSSSSAAKDSAKEKELSRKISLMADKERSYDTNAVPKLVRMLMLVAMAAYAGYNSYLQSLPDALSTDLIKKEMPGVHTGFDRNFFDLSTVQPRWLVRKVKSSGAEHFDIDTAFDEAGKSGSSGSKKESIVDLAPTFECGNGWFDTTSISFTILMILGTISDRLLKSKPVGKKQEEGIAGWLSWFWENYDQGMDLVLDYIYNYIGEYACYWMVIVGVSATMSYFATNIQPEAAEDFHIEL